MTYFGTHRTTSQIGVNTVAGSRKSNSSAKTFNWLTTNNTFAEKPQNKNCMIVGSPKRNSVTTIWYHTKKKIRFATIEEDLFICVNLLLIKAATGCIVPRLFYFIKDRLQYTFKFFNNSG